MTREPLIGIRCAKCGKEITFVRPDSPAHVKAIVAHLEDAKRAHKRECPGDVEKIET